MIRFLIRFAALACLAIAVIFGVIDSARSVAASKFVYTPLGQSWLDASPDMLDAVRAFAEQRLWTPLWDPGMVTVLLAPGFVVFLVLAFLLFVISHRPRRGLGRIAFEGVAVFFLSRMLDNKLHMPDPGSALPGRARPIATARSHHVFRRPLRGEPPAGMEKALFALGCFWGAERLFWQVPGVWMTAAGFCGGFTPNPTYQEVCTGLTGHAETVQVTFDPQTTDYGELLRLFWEAHDPTQGMRQGNDIGTAYRSAIFTLTGRQQQFAEASRDAYQQAIARAGGDRITTVIAPSGAFYHAEAEHQQYLSRNPSAECRTRGTGVAFPSSWRPGEG